MLYNKYILGPTLLITLSLLLFSTSIYSQSVDKDPLDKIEALAFKKATSYFATFHRFQFTNTAVYNSFGIAEETFLGKHFGFELGISVGKDNIEASIGILLLPFVKVLNDNYNADPDDLGNYLKKSLFYLLFLEHLNYHIKLNRNFQLTPYVSLLRMTHLNDNENNGVVKTSWRFNSGSAAGIKAGLTINNKWLLNIYSEWSVFHIKGYPSGFQNGLNLGIILPEKKK